MRRGRTLLRVSLARAVRALGSALLLLMLVGTGRGYLYCHMMQGAMSSCCCRHAGASHDSGRDSFERPACCEERGAEHQLPAVDPPASRVLAQLLAASNAAVSVPAPRVSWPRAWMSDPPGALPARAPPARASPYREGKRRALHGVMRC